MCFRPAAISMKTCPECGKANKPIAMVCEACGAELPDDQASTIDDPGAFKAPGPPGAPKAPGAPETPVAPAPPKSS